MQSLVKIVNSCRKFFYKDDEWKNTPELRNNKNRLTQYGTYIFTLYASRISSSF